MANNKPASLEYLSLVQVGDDVSGYMFSAREQPPYLCLPADGYGCEDSEGDITSTSWPVYGHVDGDAIILQTEGNLTLTGRKIGESIVLTWATTVNNIGILTYRPSTQQEFNQALSQWRIEFEPYRRAYMITDLFLYYWFWEDYKAMLGLYDTGMAEAYGGEGGLKRKLGDILPIKWSVDAVADIPWTQAELDTSRWQYTDTSTTVSLRVSNREPLHLHLGLVNVYGHWRIAWFEFASN